MCVCIFVCGFSISFYFYANFGVVRKKVFQLMVQHHRHLAQTCLPAHHNQAHQRLRPRRQPLPGQPPPIHLMVNHSHSDIIRCIVSVSHCRCLSIEPISCDCWMRTNVSYSLVRYVQLAGERQKLLNSISKEKVSLNIIDIVSVPL